MVLICKKHFVHTFPLIWTLPYLSSQMITGDHPLLTDGHTCSQVFPHWYKWLLKNLKIAQLPLHISPQRSTLYINTQTQQEKISNLNYWQACSVQTTCTVFWVKFLGRQLVSFLNRCAFFIFCDIDGLTHTVSEQQHQHLVVFISLFWFVCVCLSPTDNIHKSDHARFWIRLKVSLPPNIVQRVSALLHQIHNIKHRQAIKTAILLVEKQRDTYFGASV